MESVWLTLSRKDLGVEQQQCADEGKDITSLQAEFDALDVDEVWADPDLRARAGELLDRTALLPIRPDYPYSEPSRLDEILAVRPSAAQLPAMKLSREALLDKAHGAWTARCGSPGQAYPKKSPRICAPIHSR